VGEQLVCRARCRCRAPASPPPLGPGDLLHEPADRGARQHDRQRCPTLDRARAAHHGLGPTVDRRRLHARPRQPADALRLDGRPAGAAQGLRARSRAVHPRFAAVQRCPQPGLADRLSDAAGSGGLDAQPGRHVDHPQRLHRCPRACSGNRDVGSHRRGQPGARSCRWGCPRGVRRLALDLLDQRTRRPARTGAGNALRPRVARSTPAARGPCGATAGHGPTRRPDLRDHRGSLSGLDLSPEPRPVRLCGRRSRGAARV
jgi:hypothetical protein